MVSMWAEVVLHCPLVAMKITQDVGLRHLCVDFTFHTWKLHLCLILSASFQPLLMDLTLHWLSRHLVVQTGILQKCFLWSENKLLSFTFGTVFGLNLHQHEVQCNTSVCWNYIYVTTWSNPLLHVMGDAKDKLCFKLDNVALLFSSYAQYTWNQVLVMAMALCLHASLFQSVARHGS